MTYQFLPTLNLIIVSIKLKPVFGIMFGLFILIGRSDEAFSQIIHLALPENVEAQVGKELIIGINVKGLLKYEIKMSGNPGSSRIINNRFVWTPKISEEKFYNVRFQLIDSTNQILDESDLNIRVSAQTTHPYLVFDPGIADTIHVTENEPYSLVARIKSTDGRATQSVTPYFLFNEDPNLRKFDSCRVNRIGDQISFSWVPSNREAIQGLATLRITLIDVNQSMSSKVLNFKIKNVNRQPYFKEALPDTVYLPLNQDLSINCSAVDPDNDILNYDLTPKSPFYTFKDHNVIFKSINNIGADLPGQFPFRFTVTVSDGQSEQKKTICVLKGRDYGQLSIGDFTRKTFSEGDSVLTYLNISGVPDSKPLIIKHDNLTLPRGIGDISKRLVFERRGAYIKVYSKGVLPYYLVDRDYTYSIAISISAGEQNARPAHKVLELFVENKPDPTAIGNQRDTLLKQMNEFLRREALYKASLDKIYTRVSRPWWKKVAAITGTLSGVLILVQSQDPDKTISTMSASISLVSILVSNLPSLSENVLSELNNKISSSKGRTERLQEKETELRAIWLWDIDQTDFDRMKAEVSDLLDKSQLKREEEICSLMTNKTVKRKLDKLIHQKANTDIKKAELSQIFKCENSK